MSDAEDHPMDPAGCVLAAVRFGGCMTLLYVLMFIGILLAAVISIVFL